MPLSPRWFWDEPRVPNPPRRVWRDWALVGVLIPAATFEAIFRPDVLWRAAAYVFAIAVIIGLLFRRSHPRLVAGLAFGGVLIADIAGLIWADQEWGLFSTACILILPYALCRWGSGREAASVVPLILLLAVLQEFGPEASLGDGVIAAFFFMLPAELGAVIRFQVNAQERSVEQMKAGVREELARELHDTVAHHVSAIAIQAQAGRFLAGQQSLEGAADALEVIEEEASRTLAEMRTMIGVLRRVDSAELISQHTLAEIEDLATDPADEGLTVSVEMNGDLESLRPAVKTAIYRMAQESVTNASRYARNATKVEIKIVAGPDAVKLVAFDNGAPSVTNSPATSPSSTGYGLVGMSERVSLLGGTFAAGPGSSGGWVVRAEIPREHRESL